jgi:predicted regulator of Ras-like GTPase activity (Roadblock/LC7/MglB family)
MEQTFFAEPSAPAFIPEPSPVNEARKDVPAENPRLSIAVEPDVPPLSIPFAEPPIAPSAPLIAVLPPPPIATQVPSVQQVQGTVSPLGELFNQPGKTDWTPNELVRLTCELPGVIGAVVALEEGLVVAQKLPEGLSSETFAAFMPQIFSRLDKYTGEMQLGETGEVMITTAGGPCRFFRRGKLFFATLGRSGGTLPAGLQIVADELASQNS